jgi:hypothetical protein
MCLGSKPKAAPPPAAPPPPPLEAPEEPGIGKRRREETRDNFGTDRPTYRVDRTQRPKMTPDGPIKM